MVPKSDMNNRNQMNGLFPIIRRVRRPLLPVDRPADAKPVPAPAPSKPEQGPAGLEPRQPNASTANERATNKRTD